jgi:hypothetical protein
LAGLGFLCGALVLGFYVVLSRSETTLRVPPGLRVLSVVTAVIFTALLAPAAVKTIESWGYYLRTIAASDWRTGGASVVALARDPNTINFASELAGVLATFAYIGLLIAFFRHPRDPSSPLGDAPASRPLYFLTKTALIIMGIWVVFNVLRVAIAPLIYSSLFETAANEGRRASPLRQMFLDGTRNWLEQACLWVAPYVVYNSWPRAD